MKRYRVVASLIGTERYIYVGAKNKTAALNAAMLSSGLCWGDILRVQVQIMKAEEVL